MRSLFLLFVALAAGCGPSSPDATTPSAPVTMTPATCSGDAPWLVQALGKVPSSSGIIRLEVIKRNAVIGAELAQAEAKGGLTDGLLHGDHDFKAVRRPVEESYEWRGYDVPHGSAVVVVLRQASGRDPRTLGEFGGAPTFGAPVRLPSGVMEYPPASPGSKEAKGLYTFADGTWIGVDEWMLARFRPMFSNNAASPPPPPVDPDIGWEYCFPNGGNELEAHVTKAATPNIPGLKTRNWFIKGDRWVWRVYASHPTTELIYAFHTPELAAKAEAEQRARCIQGGCEGLIGASVEGPIIRFALKTSTD